MSENKSPFEGYCILELFGHRKLAGYVSEMEIAGQGFLRLDVPGTDGEGDATQLYNPSSVYAMTPCTEELARAVAEGKRPRPVSRYELPSPRDEHEEEPFEEDDDERPF
jgi:hypothetical protein